MIWEGWNLDYWAQRTTFYGKGRERLEDNRILMFSGYDELGIGDIIPDIPLHIRYKSFCDRLERKLSQH